MITTAQLKWKKNLCKYNYLQLKVLCSNTKVFLKNILTYFLSGTFAEELDKNCCIGTEAEQSAA